MEKLRKWAKNNIPEGTRLWKVLAASFRSPRARHDRALRGSLKQKDRLRWWLVYGAARTGTTYMVDMIANAARLKVSDWCLDRILQLTPAYDYVKFDRQRALRDISDNIIDNAYFGQRGDLDLVFKEANLEIPEYETLVQMWGKPERTIFCFRQPAGYISSGQKHFSGEIHIPIPRLQELYVKLFENHRTIGGDPFEYGPHLKLDDYLSFLKPLKIDKASCQPFAYKGEDKNEFTTDAMWKAYHGFKNGIKESIL